MSRQIDQEIIQATDELKKDVALTTDIITGNENTVVEVSPGNTVRSPKKMIEDCYQETQQAIEEKFGSLDKAISDAGAEADRAEVASQSSSDSAGDSAASASAANDHRTAAELAQTRSEAAAVDSEEAKIDSETAASQSENHATRSGQSATAALDSQNGAKASETAAAKSASDSLTHSQTSAGSADDSRASAEASAAENAKAQQSVVDATAQADRAETEADRAEVAGRDSLKITNNLADLADKPVSRTNLDVYSKGETDNKIDSKDSLPDQAEHNGKFLQTDGTITTWQPAAISNPNLLINGDFSVWQRGTNVTTTSQNFAADRWFFHLVSGNTVNVIREITTALPNTASVTYARCKLSSTGSTFYMTQRVEGSSRYFSGVKLTLSFYARTVGSSSNSMTSSIVYRKQDKTWIKEVKGELLSIDNEWRFFSTTFTTDEVASDPKYFLEVCLFSTSNMDVSEVDVANAKIEVSPVATPFIPDDPATNLAKCQRYYYRLSRPVAASCIVGNPSEIRYLELAFPTTMRAVPTMSGNASRGIIETNSPGKDVFRIRFISVPLTIHTELLNGEFDAEL